MRSCMQQASRNLRIKNQLSQLALCPKKHRLLGRAGQPLRMTRNKPYRQERVAMVVPAKQLHAVNHSLCINLNKQGRVLIQLQLSTKHRSYLKTCTRLSKTSLLQTRLKTASLNRRQLIPSFQTVSSKVSKPSSSRRCSCSDRLCSHLWQYRSPETRRYSYNLVLDHRLPCNPIKHRSRIKACNSLPVSILPTPSPFPCQISSSLLHSRSPSTLSSPMLSNW